MIFVSKILLSLTTILVYGLLLYSQDQSAVATSITFTTIDDPNAGPNGTRGAEINDAGQIAGEYWDTSGYLQSFFDSSGTFIKIEDPNAVGYSDINNPDAAGGTAAGHINNAGQIVGWYSDSSHKFHGFLYSSGTFTTIDVPNARGTNLDGINDAGQIVGDYIDSSIKFHGFLYSSGTFTTIDVPNNIGISEPSGINNAGQIVGWYQDNSYNFDGFLYSSGTFTTIDVPKANQTQVGGINNVGQISGGYVDSSGNEHGFIANLVGTVATPSISIPNWIKNVAKNWGTNQIDDSTFLHAIQYMIQNKIIVIPSTTSISSSTHSIPLWVKKDTIFWSQGMIGDETFAQALQYLIVQEIITP